MNKEKLLDEMISACKGIVDAAIELKAILAVENAPEVEPKPAGSEDHLDPPNVYTFQEVRAIMATLSGKGKKAEAKALLAKYGASRLSEISESDYPALVEDAEVIASE